MAVSGLWSIGHRWAEQLQALGIKTALQLRDNDPARLQARFGVVMPRLIYELRGMSCLDLDMVNPPKQQIIASRSFGRSVTDQEELRQAVASHVARAAIKLRRQQSVAQALMVFIHTNRFQEQESQSCRACTLTLPAPTADTGKLVGYAVKGVDALYQEGFRYKKAGVMLLNLSSAVQGQLDLLDIFLLSRSGARKMNVKHS